MRRASVTPLLRRVIEEPLVQFAALGAVIFGVHAAYGPSAPPPDERTVLVDPTFIEALRARESVAAGTEMSTSEVEAAWIREEVLVRESTRLGLDRADPVVRRRLVQKMELLLAADISTEPIDDETLRRELEARAERYQAPATVAFEHVFLADDPGRADEVRAALEAGTPPAALSAPFLHGLVLARRPLEAVRGSFGPDFAHDVETASIGEWSGPFRSAYGAHVVRVTERHPGGLASLDAVRGRLTSELLDERREAQRDERVEALVGRYRVERIAVEPAAP